MFDPSGSSVRRAQRIERRKPHPTTPDQRTDMQPTHAPQVKTRTASRAELAHAIALLDHDDEYGTASGDVPELLQGLPLDRITRQRVATLAAGWSRSALFGELRTR